jgi:hypothetical protein
MRRISFVFFAIVMVMAVNAQTSNEKSPTAFKLGGYFSLMGGQSGSKNWSQGAEKFSLAGIASLYLTANKTSGSNTFENSLDLSYGLVNTSSQDVRKIDDKFDLYSRYGHTIKGKFGVGVVGNLRTQFTDGFDYTEEPKKRISGFFAPAYLTASAGAQWKPTTGLTMHLGPAIRWIIITNNPYSLNYQGAIKPDGTTERTLASLYDVIPGREVRIEVGPYLSTTFQKEIMKNVAYRGRLDLLMDLLNEVPNKGIMGFKPHVDIYMTNNFMMTVNKWLKVNYSLDVVYDDNVRMFGKDKKDAATQLKSILAVGLAASF